MNGDSYGAIRTEIALEQIARRVVRLREFNDRDAELAVVRIAGKRYVVSPVNAVPSCLRFILMHYDACFIKIFLRRQGFFSAYLIRQEHNTACY